MRRLAVICLLLAAAQGLWAEIPLELETAIQLPAGGAWDVQHWLDEESFGWATVNGRTIVYQTRLEDALQEFEVSDSLFMSYFFCAEPTHERIYLLRAEERGNHPCVLLLSEGEDCAGGEWWYAYTVYTWIDLADGIAVAHTALTSSHWADHGQIWGGYSIVTNDIVIWPPPPHSTEWILLGESYSDTWSHQNMDVGVSYGLVTIAALSNNFDFVQAGNGAGISAFVTDSSARFALTAFRSSFSHYYGDPPQSTSSSSNWIQTFQPPDHLSVADSIAVSRAVAQQDENGTQRIIVPGVKALDANTYAELWQDSTIGPGNIYTARLAGSADERMLVTGPGNRFRVYRADNGLFLDRTGDYTGTLRYWVKRPGINSEFVTEADRTVRVYTSATPIRLSCSPTDTADSLRLDWSGVPEAVYYSIYGSWQPGGAEFHVADVPGTLAACTVPAWGNLQFFYVVAVRNGEALTRVTHYSNPEIEQ